MAIELTSLKQLHIGQVLIKTNEYVSPTEVRQQFNEPNNMFIVLAFNDKTIVLKKACFHKQGGRIEYSVKHFM
ncbi:MAG: hypothetical protein JWN76_38 [Chitinophagaceae bacterium]|nr:hypothetical protein [Chitinophagaceae bacterium]